MAKRHLCLAIFVCVFVLWAPGGAIAQEEARFEAFGSFSYLIADVGGSGLGLDDVSGIGFNGGFAFFLNDWLGLGAEVGYNRGDLGLPVIAIFPTPDIDFSQWTLLFGPRFRLGGTERFRIGAQTMAGVAHGSIDVDFSLDDLIINVPGQGPRRFSLRALDVQADDTVFALLLGVHFDLKLDERLTWRIIEPDLLITNYGSDGQAHFRISSGLGFEF